MATVTTAEQPGMHSAMSFSPLPAATAGDGYSMALEDEISPISPLFPAGQPSPSLRSSGPIPNPPFVFPARQGPSSAPSSLSRATGRGQRQALDSQGELAGSIRNFSRGPGRSPPPPLPNFSFSLAASTQDGLGTSSPPQSPTSPGGVRAIPSRPGGHRRGGSEFIGGDGKSGTGLGLMSTSPTKGDGVLPPPNSQPILSASTGRRGHAHRRSAAISCHDISMIIKPPTSSTLPIGGSAPTTPSANGIEHPNLLDLDDKQVNVESDAAVQEVDEISGAADSPPVRSSNRARVGFSDTIEFIPRPLSLVSSDASSTMTVRPGHSVSNSLSSLMSAGNASPSGKEQRDLSSAAKAFENRPSTAGAVLGSATDGMRLNSGNSSPLRQNSFQLTAEESLKVVEGPPTPRLIPKKYFFFSHDSTGGESSPTRSRPVSSASDKPRGSSNTSPPSSPEHMSSDVPITSTEEDPMPQRRPSVTRKPSKNKKKVRSWAGSILSRKPRHSKKQKALSRRSPTPPLRSFEPVVVVEPASDPDSIDMPFDAEEKTQDPNPLGLQTNFASWKPRHVTPQEDMSPMIDLDAALGPFNTPSGYDPNWEASQRGPGQTKRRMHSAAGPYHRRAESAPEMVAFDNPRYGLHHIGSRSTMEDVFEEDEEDDWEEDNTVSHKGSQTKMHEEEGAGLGIDINIADVRKSNSEKVMDWADDSDAYLQRGLKRKGSGLSEGDRRQTSSSSKSEFSVRDEALVGENTSELGITDESAASRPSSGAKSSPTSPTPPLRPHAPKDLAPVDIQPVMFQQPFLTPTSFQSTSHSSFPSPRSPMSYDAQRISTAPSSITDEHAFQSLLLGEPGPELRMSVDDVPSLTSSNSTMTRESTITPGHPGFGNPQFRNSQRSASLSGPSATRKRSSIASLSRLLHSSHGEKSKLSIEERAPTSPERKAKEGKGKRLSRMMQFWKPKDASPS